MMDKLDNDFSHVNVYNSGLNAEDWKSLRDVIWPFLHAKDPSQIEVPKVPDHLVDHPLIKNIQSYKKTSDVGYLDEAGKCLIPTDVNFGWYTALTK